MNFKLKETFSGKVVNKAHTINTGVDEFPLYVLEYLIDNYCSEETFRDDKQKVVRRLKETFVYGAEAEGLPASIRQKLKITPVQSIEEVLSTALLSD